MSDGDNRAEGIGNPEGAKSCATCWFYMPEPFRPQVGACAFHSGTFHINHVSLYTSTVYIGVAARDGRDCEYHAIDRDAADEVMTEWLY